MLGNRIGVPLMLTGQNDNLLKLHLIGRTCRRQPFYVKTMPQVQDGGKDVV